VIEKKKKVGERQEIGRKFGGRKDEGPFWGVGAGLKDGKLGITRKIRRIEDANSMATNKRGDRRNRQGGEIDGGAYGLEVRRQCQSGAKGQTKRPESSLAVKV